MTATTASPPATTPIAPWRHTVILCTVLLAIAAAGFAASHFATGQAPPQPGTPAGFTLYPMLLLAQLALFLVVRAGIRRRGVRVADLVSARGFAPASLAIDFLLGLALVAAFALIEALLQTGAGTPPIVQRLLVHTPAEIPLWILVSLAAGFVEELVFRGYLQRQFAALAGPVAAILLQALLFAIVHGYQGWEPLLRIGLLALLLGVMAAARRSLVPGMVAHALIDIIGGLGLR
jgi:membrane protease YdiL (CAAX protease family)